MKLKDLKAKGLTCNDYLTLLISQGFMTVKEVLESEK